MASKEKVTSVEERLRDIRRRWIEEPVRQGKEPRIDKERYVRAAENVQHVAQEIFGLLGTTDEQFIHDQKLNETESMKRWEKFLLSTREKRREQRAFELVKHFIDRKGERK